MFYKLVTFIYLFFYTVCGVGELVIITYVLLRRYSLRYFLEALWQPILGSLSVPFLTIIIIILGWLAIRDKSSAAIKLVAIFQGVSLFIAFAFALWIFTERQELDAKTDIVLTEKFPNEAKNGTDKWDALQRELDCCGIHGPYDYRKDSKAVPFSCCNSTMFLTCEVYSKGCARMLVNVLTEDFDIISLSLTVLGVLQVPGVLIAFKFFASQMQASI